jgi:hypothetical protein
MSVSGACASCHDGLHPPADGRSAHHIPYQTLSGTNIASCDSCHKGGFGSWTPARFHSNVAITTQCASCHISSAYGLTSKPATAIHSGVTGNCESCHKSTSAWAGARVDHASFTTATNCSSCHNGSTARGKESSHIQVNATNCITCHNTTGWLPSKWNHTQLTVSNTCSSCHDGAHPPADGRSANHIPYTALSGAAISNCDTCHKSGYNLWSGARFHSSVAIATQCSSCHLSSAYGLTAKPSTAIHNGVTGNCESCHKSTSAWSGARVDHSTFTSATNCASCHNGTSARGKEASHIQVNATNCFTCHNTSGWIPSKWNHTQLTVSNTCSTCHDGAHAPADGRPPTHIPYTALSGTTISNCDSCHKSGYSLWSGARFHTSIAITTQCSSCHLTSAYGLTAKPSTAIHNGVTGNCESCHKSTSAWSGARVNHSTFTAATNCASCHNGTSARGKETSHIQVNATNCITCHNTTGWIPSKWNHTQLVVTGTCSTCHDGAHPPADGRPATHIPYTTLSGAAITNCDTCHKSGFNLWSGARFHSSVAMTSQCSSCHLTSAYGLTAKPSTPIHNGVTGNCESCHTSTSSWAGARVNHSSFTAATNCASCHNGTTARGKEVSHIPVNATNCITCHNTTGWIPSKWNHTQLPVTNTCSSCHDGAHRPADGRSTNHIPYQLLSGVAIINCDSCHKSGFGLWSGARFHSNVSLSSQCATCHLTTAYGRTGKPATPTHSTVTGNCESCHRSTAAWLTNLVFTHSPANAVGTGTCDTCHNGTAARGKTPGHIPIPTGIAKCDSCHRSQTNFATAITMNHTAVSAAECKTCHNGNYTTQGTNGARGKMANHIPEAQLLNGAAMDCKACHTSTTSFATMRMNHNSSLGNGAGWCKSCHASGTAFQGNMEKKSLNHRGGTAIKTDCSQSGCHRPLGNTGAAYTKWN